MARPADGAGKAHGANGRDKRPSEEAKIEEKTSYQVDRNEPPQVRLNAGPACGISPEGGRTPLVWPTEALFPNEQKGVCAGGGRRRAICTEACVSPERNPLYALDAVQALRLHAPLTRGCPLARNAPNPLCPPRSAKPSRGAAQPARGWPRPEGVCETALIERTPNARLREVCVPPGSRPIGVRPDQTRRRFRSSQG